MKHLLFCLLLPAGSAWAQKTTSPETDGAYSTRQNRAYAKAPAIGLESAVPFKGANTISLFVKDSSAAAYAKLARLLLADGYSIEKSDKELGYINTGYHASRFNRAVEGAVRFVINPQAGGSKIMVQGVFRMPGMATAFRPQADSPIECRGMFGSPSERAWLEMERICKAYPEASIAYLRRP